jgi:hypothetical protein
MPGDRMLGTLLRALQTYTEQEDTPRYNPIPPRDAFINRMLTTYTAFLAPPPPFLQLSIILSM